MKKLAIGLVVLVLAGAGAWLAYQQLFGGSAEDEFTLEGAVPTSAPGAPTSAPADLAGDWVVVAPSEAGYRIVEDAIAAEKVVTGRTTGVSGSLTLSTTALTATEVTVDMGSVASDEQLRDVAFRETLLDTAQFPTAVFRQDEPVPLEVPPDGRPLTVEVPGTLELRGVEQPVTASIEGVVADRTMTLVGTIEVELADFGIDPPSIPNVLTARDSGQVEFKLVLEPR